jgi:hypothetical protein
MSFRKEIKFRLSKYDFDLLKNDLLLKGMQPLYKKRNINSLYYDTQTLKMFNDSEEGLLPRKKIRIRWYNDITFANMEVKISSVEGRFKTTTMNGLSSKSYMPKNLFDNDYGALTPSLLVSYTREYFTLNSMRLTFDSSIKYVNYRQSQSIKYQENESVMEIKVFPHISDDYIKKIIPWSTSRFSKYCRGILSSINQV